MRRILFLAFLLTTPLLAAETGYRIVHPDGTVEYTDQPGTGGEEIRMPEVPTYPSQLPQTQGRSPRASAPAMKQAAGYRSLAISSPREQETVWFNADGMNVSVQLQPGLAAGDEVVIRLDGTIVARGNGTAFSVKNVYRGPHTVSAAILDQQGSVLLEAEPVTFYMRQHAIRTP